MACEQNKILKSAPPNLISDSQNLQEISDSILESAIEYVILSELKLAFRDENSVGNLRISRQGLSEDVGRAVMAVVEENRKGDVCREIAEIECDLGESSDVFSESVQSFLDSKMTSFGSRLAGGEERDCLMFMAIVCEMVVQFSTSPRVNCLTIRIINKAKEVMRNYAECNDFYLHVETYCRSFLKRHCGDDIID